MRSVKKLAKGERALEAMAHLHAKYATISLTLFCVPDSIYGITMNLKTTKLNQKWID